MRKEREIKDPNHQKKGLIFLERVADRPYFLCALSLRISSPASISLSPSVALSIARTLRNVKTLVGQYTGHALVSRLIFVAKKAAEKNDEALELDALKISYDEAKKVSARRLKWKNL